MLLHLNGNCKNSRSITSRIDQRDNDGAAKAPERAQLCMNLQRNRPIIVVESSRIDQRNNGKR